MASVVVVSASYDKQIRLWDATSGRTVKSFVFQDSQINSLYLLPDTGYLAVAGFGALRLYDLGTFLHSGSGAGVGGGAGASGSGSTANQAPPVYSSFESQSSMNFTSLAAVPLVRNDNSNEQSSTLSGSSRQLTESASSAMVNDHLLSTVVMADGAALLGASPFREVSLLLVATSEDGHIRFFDTRSAVTLRMLKDVATGAAITCSAVSPDRRYLLTGNQMGQVSMWHLPSIVASVTLEVKSHAHHKMAAASKTSDGDLIAATGGADTNAEETQSAAEEERAKVFGRAPLQDINFSNDYSAIRSIAIEPLGRWAAVATNAGKVHFIRLAHDASVHGSKASTESKESATQQPIIGAGACSDPQITPREQQERHGRSLSSSLQISPQKSPGQNSAAGSASGVPPSQLALTGGSVGSHGEGGTTNNSCRGPRETIYRSALVVNELSSNAHRASDASLEGVSGGGDTANMPNAANGGVSHPNSMGAVLLDHLEQQRNSSSGRSSRLGGEAATAPHDQPVQQSAAAKLAEELEMEVFDTIQAHYKYILRVLISPNAELLVTCSADYSVGRFLVPAALRMSPSASTVTGASAATKFAAVAAAEAPSPPFSARPSGTRKDDKGEAESESVDKAEVRGDAFTPSLASTQVLPLSMGSRLGSGSDQSAQVPQQQQDSMTGTKMGDSSPNENAMAAAATSDNRNTAHDASASGSPGRSFGAANRGIDDGETDETQQPRMEFEPLKPLCGHNRWVWDGVFSDCSNFLFTASSDNTLRMWNGLMTERPQSVSFVGHTKPVVAVLLCYDKRCVSSA